MISASKRAGRVGWQQAIGLLTSPRVSRPVAGTIGASLAVQFSLLINGVATARLLGVLDRGHIALFILLATVIPMVGTLGVPLALTYWIAREPHITRPLLRRVRPLVMCQLAAVSTIHLVVLYIVFRHSPPYVQRAAAVSLLGSPALACWGYGLAILQGRRRFKALNLSRMVSPPISAAVVVGLWLAGLRSLFLVTLTAVTLFWATAVITGIAAMRGLPHAEAGTETAAPSRRALVSFGLRALLGSITPLEAFQLDQAIVGLFLSQALLGIYVVGVAFTNLPRFLAQAIGLVAYPQVAAERDADARRRSTLRFLAATALLCGATIILLELALPVLVTKLFGVAFDRAVGVARILLLSALLFALRRVFTECARGAGRPALGSIAEVVSLVCLFPAVAVFFRLGAQGVAIALVFAAAAGLLAMTIGWMGGSARLPWLGRARLPQASSSSEPVTVAEGSRGERYGSLSSTRDL